MALTCGTKLGPYEVQLLLGAGGMGEVYRARDTRLERMVAIRILPVRSEEHTSELQSQSNIVCRLLLETKNASAAVGAGQRRLGQGMGMQIEADEGRGRRLVNRKLVEVKRETPEHVAIRIGAPSRASAA